MTKTIQKTKDIIKVEGYITDNELTTLKWFHRWTEANDEKEETKIEQVIKHNQKYNNEKFNEMIQALMTGWDTKLIITLPFADRGLLTLFVVLLYTEKGLSLKECLDFYFISENTPKIETVSEESKREPEHLGYKVKLKTKIIGTFKEELQMKTINELLKEGNPNQSYDKEYVKLYEYHKWLTSDFSMEDDEIQYLQFNEKLFAVISISHTTVLLHLLYNTWIDCEDLEELTETLGGGNYSISPLKDSGITYDSNNTNIIDSLRITLEFGIGENPFDEEINIW